MLFSFVGCDSDTTPVFSGSYYAVGDYEEMLTPYLSLDTDNNEFRFGAGSVVSYQEYGSYKIADGKIIATSQSTTFEFEIKDKNTLILIDNGDNDFFKFLSIRSLYIVKIWSDYITFGRFYPYLYYFQSLFRK